MNNKMIDCLSKIYSTGEHRISRVPSSNHIVFESQRFQLCKPTAFIKLFCMMSTGTYFLCIRTVGNQCNRKTGFLGHESDNFPLHFSYLCNGPNLVHNNLEAICWDFTIHPI